ncbi:MAG: START-like domain-containing protein [Tannerellaceae bacterium]
MKKEKFQVEYVFDKVSLNSLWKQITTNTGLAEWFADNVEIDGDIYTFEWNKTYQKAKRVDCKSQSKIQFKWIEEDEPDLTFFEFKIAKVELTGSTSLEITDFAETEEKGDAINLWDSQVDALKRSLGI